MTELSPNSSSPKQNGTEEGHSGFEVPDNNISEELISKHIDCPILTENTLEIPAIQNALEEGCNAIIQQLPGKAE